MVLSQYYCHIFSNKSSLAHHNVLSCLCVIETETFDLELQYLSINYGHGPLLEVQECKASKGTTARAWSQTWLASFKLVAQPTKVAVQYQGVVAKAATGRSLGAAISTYRAACRDSAARHRASCDRHRVVWPASLPACYERKRSERGWAYCVYAAQAVARNEGDPTLESR